jgi:hypothetical protein
VSDMPGVYIRTTLTCSQACSRSAGSRPPELVAYTACGPQLQTDELAACILAAPSPGAVVGDGTSLRP